MSEKGHNKKIKPLLDIILGDKPEEADAWLLIESITLGVGMYFDRSPSDTAVFVELIAERLVSQQSIRDRKQ